MSAEITNVSFESLKEDIIRVFKRLHQKLDERKQFLMGQLLAIKEGTEPSTDLDKGIRHLKETKEMMLSNLLENVFGREREVIEKTFDDQIKVTESRRLSKKSCLDKLHSYTAKLEKDIAQISLVEDIPAYSRTLTPAIKCGVMGSGQGEFNFPRGICIDAANNVYVTDSLNKRIQVLSNAGQYVNSFGTRNLTEPWGVAVTELFVFVTDQVQHSIVKFGRDGAFISTVGSHGSGGSLEFNCPRGLAAYSDNLYVCDCVNHRIQVVGASLKYIEAFRSHELAFPSDIYITAAIIHVLQQTGNSVHLFINPGYFPLQVIKLTRQFYNMTSHFFFTVDQLGNYLISAQEECHIRIFDNTGTLRQIIGKGHMKCPTGISLDSDNNIICVTGDDNNKFQMY